VLTLGNSNWHWPNIEGLSDFKGHKTHSAAWDENYDYSNKTIAVLGNGSSGVQIIPQLANLPNTKLVAFQRTPNYVYTHLAPSLLEKREETKNNPAYSEEEKRHFREDPAYLRAYRQKLIHQINSAFKMVRQYSTLFTSYF
jgi:cation diffusion facilitator CzcD-associated flavoprotein CzcO